jgi:hypothetical protein
MHFIQRQIDWLKPGSLLNRPQRTEIQASLRRLQLLLVELFDEELERGGPRPGDAEGEASRGPDIPTTALGPPAPSAPVAKPIPPDAMCVCGHNGFHHALHGECDASRGGIRLDDCTHFRPADVGPEVDDPDDSCVECGGHKRDVGELHIVGGGFFCAECDPPEQYGDSKPILPTSGHDVGEDKLDAAAEWLAEFIESRLEDAEGYLGSTAWDNLRGESPSYFTKCDREAVWLFVAHTLQTIRHPASMPGSTDSAPIDKKGAEAIELLRAVLWVEQHRGVLSNEQVERLRAWDLADRGLKATSSRTVAEGSDG